MSRLSVALLALFLIAAPVPAQEDEVGLPYWVSTPPGAGAALGSAMAALANRDWPTAARTIQSIFDRFPFSFAKTSRRGPYIGAARRARELLGSSPDALRAEYERLFGPQAEEALRRGLAAADRDALLDVVRRFEATRAGLAAILALSDRALLRGRPAEARLLLARVKALHPVASSRPDIARRTALAAARDHAEGGPPPRPDEKQGDAPRVAPLPRDAWPMLAGAAARNAVATAPSFHPVRNHVPVHIPERLWDRPPRPASNYGYPRGPRFGIDWDEKWHDYNPIHPVVARGMVVFSDGRSVTAVNLYTGEQQWTRPTSSEAETDGRTNLGNLFSPVVADGVVYASIEVPVVFRPQNLQGVPITYYLPRRRLMAIDLDSEEILWQHDEEWLARHRDEPLASKLSFTGVPLVRGDHIYVGAWYTEGTFHNYLVAIDRHTGEITQATRISNGQQELNLFGRQLQECAPTPVAEADGVLYYGTNLGMFAAVDALLGAPLWATSYPIVPIPSTYYWFEAPRRWARFDNGPPVISGDTVLVAPSDGVYLLALDRTTGRERWRRPWQMLDRDQAYRLRTLQGADDERVYLSGESAVVALWLIDDPARGAKPGELAWACRFGKDDDDNTRIGAGRGLLTEEGLWIPTYSAIFVIDPASGKRRAILERAGRDADAPVHLVWGDGVLVTAGRDFVAMRYDQGDAIGLARQRVRDFPDRIGPLIAAADVYLATGNLGQAVSHYKRAATRADAVGARASAGRARQGLHRALFLRALGVYDTDPDRAPAEFEAAFKAAPDERTRYKARRRLDEVLASGPAAETAEWRLKNLRAIEREHGALVDEKTGRSVRAIALRHMAEILANLRQVKRALVVLHDLLELDATGEDGRWASRSIRELLELEGRQHYDAYERRARELFATARESGDLEALERGLHIYANASAAVPATLRLARDRLEDGASTAAVRVLQHFLIEYPASERTPEALVLMVEALHARASYGPAYATLLRLKNRYGDQRVPRADGARVGARDVAEEWLARDPYPALARSAQRLDLEPDLTLRFKKSFTNASYIDVPDLGGQRPESLRDAILLRGSRHVIVLDSHSAKELFRLDLRGGELKGPLVFVGDRIHAATDQWIHVFDATNGDTVELLRVPGRGRAEHLFEHQGQIFLLFRERGVRGRVGLAALHPGDGSALWTQIPDTGGTEPRVASYHAVAHADRLLLFSTHPVAVTVLDATTGTVENRVVVDSTSGTTIGEPPIILPDGRIVLGLSTAHAMGRFEYQHGYAVVLVDPASPPEAAILWRYAPPRDDASRQIHLLNLVGSYVVALDESRGAVVLDLQTGHELKHETVLDLRVGDEALPGLDHPQPRNDSLLLVLTRSQQAGDVPARLVGFELPDLRRKFVLDLTDGGREVARLVESQGVLGMHIQIRKPNRPRPRIHLIDPLNARILQEIAPPADKATWVHAKVQNGILLVTDSTSTVHGYAPR